MNIKLSWWLDRLELEGLIEFLNFIDGSVLY